MTNKRRSKGTRRPRRRVLLFLCVVAAVAIPFLFWQENGIQVERFEVISSRLPAAFDGFTMVQISDLHNKHFGQSSEHLLSAVAEQNPDIIAITGDLISRDGDTSVVSTLAKGLAAIAPTYYVTGNHEWASGELWVLRPLLKECGIIILSNEFVLLERDGMQVILTGAEDRNGRADQSSIEELTAQARNAHEDTYLILLSHRNNLPAAYSRSGADLVLTGHAHGGIVRLPFTDGLIGPSREWFPSRTAGLYPLESGGVQLVSRGLGGPRLFNRPHLPVVVLRAEP